MPDEGFPRSALAIDREPLHASVAGRGPIGRRSRSRGRLTLRLRRMLTITRRVGCGWLDSWVSPTERSGHLGPRHSQANAQSVAGCRDEFIGSRRETRFTTASEFDLPRPLTVGASRKGSTVMVVKREAAAWICSRWPLLHARRLGATTTRCDTRVGGTAVQRVTRGTAVDATPNRISTIRWHTRIPLSCGRRKQNEP